MFVQGEVDKKDDSGNETGAGEAELDEDPSGFMGYDKAKSFFDNISCEAVERFVRLSNPRLWNNLYAFTEWPNMCTVVVVLHYHYHVR